MARVKLSGIVTSISGSLGSSTFSEQPSGTTLGVRRRKTPSPSSKKVYLIPLAAYHTLDPMATMSQLRYAWSNYLGADELNAWKTYAQNLNRKRKSASGKRLDGKAAFIGHNYQAIYCGIGGALLPPYEAPYPAPAVNNVEIWTNAPWTCNVSPGATQGVLFCRTGIIPKPKSPFFPRITLLIPWYNTGGTEWTPAWDPRELFGTFTDETYWYLEFKHWFLTRPISPPTVIRQQTVTDPI